MLIPVKLIGLLEKEVVGYNAIVIFSEEAYGIIIASELA